MKRLNNLGFIALAGTVALGTVFAGEAGAVSFSQIQRQTVTGQNLTYNFTGLNPSDGTGGFINLASVAGSTFDLSDFSDEYFDLSIDGVNAGRYTCHDNVVGGINLGCGGTTNLNTFSENFTFSSLSSSFGINVANLISDGALAVGVNFGSGVNPGFKSSFFASPNPNNLKVTLDYNEATAVPTPALLPGIIGMAATALRKKRKQAEIA